MSFNELNSVEHYIIQKLSGVNLNAADATSSAVKEDATPNESFPWQVRCAEALLPINPASPLSETVFTLIFRNRFRKFQTE